MKILYCHIKYFAQIGIPFFIFTLYACSVVYGQSRPRVLKIPITIKWNQLQVDTLAGSKFPGLLTFNGSTFREEYGALPVFLQSIDLNPSEDSVDSIKLENLVFDTLPEAFLVSMHDLDKLPEKIAIIHEISVQRKKSFMQVSLVPLRRMPGLGPIDRLISFDIVLNIHQPVDILPAKSVKSYAANSVLALGSWYKFATSTNGIYKLSYEDLLKYGINVGSIDPRNIRIYGNGGGMLPEANAIPRIDDLMENSIFVYGEEDGRLDPGDYILFYGQSPDQWVYNNNDKLYHHRKNVYSDRMYYFLNFDQGRGKRLISETSSTLPATNYINVFEDYSVYENDDINLIKSGREWYDKQTFDLNSARNYSLTFPNIDNATPVTIIADVAARSVTGSTSFVVFSQGNQIMNINIPSTGGDFTDDFAIAGQGRSLFTTSNPVIDVKLVYNKNSSGSVGYLNYIEANATRKLSMAGSQMQFRSMTGVVANGVSEFTLNSSGQNLQIWDITNGDDIKHIGTSRNGSDYIFRVPTSTLREFLAFDGVSFNTPEFVGGVENQNLHATEIPGYIIITHPSFQQEAERLAAFHREYNKMSVLVTTPDKIYNEFSSGAQDITAIRDFVKMFYDRAEPGKEPKYLLLFGDASYDFKGRKTSNTNFIPAFESVSSLSPINSYVSDDYFVLLDPNEGQNANGTSDMGVGRFPITSVEEARSAVDKVLHYCAKSDSVKNSWRNIVTFVADDQNLGGNLFINDSEDLARIIETTHKEYHVDKIYSDSYNMISTPGGNRYPEVNEAINKRIGKGTLIINYVGHGGEVGWAHERILEVPDIKSWKNYDNLAVFVTATCEFSRFDDPDRVSAGEWAFLNSKGGAISLFTTTRLTFAGTNKALLDNFYNSVFKRNNGQYLKMGDLLMAAKKDMGSSPNIHAFVLLGDPAITMAYPEMKVVTTAVNNQARSLVPDTLKALDKITITGEVQDGSGQILTDFSGTVFSTVFDKSSEIWTKANYGDDSPVKFFLQKNPVYKGKTEVVNGSFTFSFIVPKDIAFKYGIGKISYYARSKETDANGFDDNIQVGGYNNNAQPDDQGPEISMFMNNHSFISGGITSPNPILIADLSDSSGINTVGSGIGHDITAVIDGKTSIPFILNDYYVSGLNTFKQGTLDYQFSALADGTHNMVVKVWDVYGNSSEAEIDFIVVSSSEFAFQHLFNYPNPMVDQTTFSWETNQVDQVLGVEIQLFSLNGELIKILRQSVYSEGFRNTSIHWDGVQDNGQKINPGIYIYRLQLILPDGTAKIKTSKLVVIR